MAQRITNQYIVLSCELFDRVTFQKDRPAVCQHFEDAFKQLSTLNKVGNSAPKKKTKAKKTKRKMTFQAGGNIPIPPPMPSSTAKTVTVTEDVALWDNDELRGSVHSLLHRFFVQG